MPKYKITATESIFGGRQSVRLRIPEGPTRLFTQRIGTGKEVSGEDAKTVEVTLTEEQALSVEQAGYEVSPSPSAAKPKSKSASSKPEVSDTSTSKTEASTSKTEAAKSKVEAAGKSTPSTDTKES